MNDIRVGDRVMVDCGYSTYRAGVVEDRWDGTVGVVFGGSNGPIWRTNPHRVQVVRDVV